MIPEKIGPELMPRKPAVVIVTPVLNDWDSFNALAKDIAIQPALTAYDISIVAVDDGSTDIAPMSAQELPRRINQLIVLELNANQGHQRAIALGLAHVHSHMNADIVIVMDSDGEDKASDIGDLLKRAKSKPGTLIVAERAKRSESPVFRLGYGIYKSTFRTLTGKPISFGNFCLIPAERLPNLLFNAGIWNNFAATMLRSRLPLEFVPTHRGERYFGSSTMNFTSLMVHGFSAISIFTDIVIGRIILGLMVASGLAAAFVGVVLYTKFFTSVFVPGYATYVILSVVTVLALTLFIGFVLILSLLSARDRSSALPTALLTLLVRRVRNVRVKDEKMVKAVS